MRALALPALLAALTFAALLAALIREGALDRVAAIALAVPLATLPWALWRARRRRD